MSLVYGPLLQKVSDSYTRPADTTAYAAADAISDSTTAPTVLTFTDAARNQGKGGIIVDATINSSAAPATTLQCELWLFDTEPTPTDDNSAFALTDAESLNVIAVIPFTVGYKSDANTIYHGDRTIVPFRCATASTTLYGLLVARNAYTPASAEVLTVTLKIEQQ